MKTNFNVTIRLTDEAANPLSTDNVAIDVILYLDGKDRYRFSCGKTDNRGSLVVTFDQLECYRLENQMYSLMDYNTPLSECDSLVSFVIPSSQDIEQRKAALEKWFGDDPGKKMRYDNCRNAEVACEVLDVDLDRIVDGIIYLICKRCMR